MNNQPGELAELTAKLLAFRTARDWEQFHNPKDQILSLVLEASELLELTQWRQGEALQSHLREKREDLADELSDVLGWILLIAHDQGIDLREAFESKLKKNEAKYPVDRAKGRAEKYTAYQVPSPGTPGEGTERADRRRAKKNARASAGRASLEIRASARRTSSGRPKLCGTTT